MNMDLNKWMITAVLRNMFLNIPAIFEIDWKCSPWENIKGN